MVVGSFCLLVFPDQLTQDKVRNTQEQFGTGITDVTGNILTDFESRTRKHRDTKPFIPLQICVQVMHLHWKLAIYPAIFMSYA